MIERFGSGSPWEASSGYSRAVRAGGFIFISATAAAGPDGLVVGRDDLAAQTRFIFEKVGAVLARAGSSLDHVVATRLYLCDMARWQEAATVHAEVFGRARPAMSLLHVRPFLDPQMLIEVELTAVARP